MRSKFESVFENYAGKYTKGGFLPGDFVKFKSDVLSHPDVKGSDDSFKAMVKELMDSDKNLRISRLTSKNATNSPSPDGTVSGYNATVYQVMPGNSATSTEHVVTVPLETLEKTLRGDDEAAARVPDSFLRAADKRVNHTNQHKATADKQSSDYDDGKDFNSGKRDNSVDGSPEEFERDSDSSGVRVKTKSKKKVTESVDSELEEAVRHSYNIKDMTDKLCDILLGERVPVHFVQRHTNEVIAAPGTKLTRSILKEIAEEARRVNLRIPEEGKIADKVRKAIIRATTHPKVVADENGFQIVVNNLKQ